MSKKKVQTEILPTKLADALEALQLTKTNKATAVQIAAAVMRLSNRERLTLEEYKSISAAYFREINHNYQGAFAAMKAGDIIQTHINEKGRQYSTAAGVAKAYRINPDLMSETISAVSFTVNSERFRATNLPERMAAWVREDLQGLQVDVQGAHGEVQDRLTDMMGFEYEVTPASPEYVLNSYSENVRYGMYPLKYKYKVRELVDTILKKAENRGKYLYRQGDGFVIDTEAAYLERKRRLIRSSWNRAIHSLTGKQFFAKKAESNNRYHTNITELPNGLLRTVTYKGEELIEVDIANSQMAALAHVMVYGDVLDEGVRFPKLNLSDATSHDFLRQCQGDGIYLEVAKLLGVQRSAAKREMFRTVFGGMNRASESWKKIKMKYPAAGAWLVEVKQLPGFNLAVYLQRLEARVMIENVYVAIKQAGFVAFSKHDSFLVPESQVEYVRGITERVMTDMGYLATLKDKHVPSKTMYSEEPCYMHDKVFQLVV